MNKLTSHTQLLCCAALLLTTVLAGCSDGGGVPLGPPTAAGAGTGVGGAGRGPAPVDLGTASNFVILAESQITNVPTSVVTGDVGLSPATGAGIGLTCAQVTGTIYTVDAAGPLPCRITDATLLTSAIGAKGTAYTDAAGRAPDYTELGAGNIGGLNLGPATYKWGTGVLIPSNVTLTGGANDVWIFQIAQGLTVASGVQIILAGGALPQNVYWQTFAAADLGTTSKFKGIILSQTSVAMKTGATLNGRLYAGTAVTLDQNIATQP
ncbi:MAG: ice-binding family protein [Gallionellaceae bacterium]|nr:ice-binding family protein [Gallionellaceae bacterium]